MGVFHVYLSGRNARRNLRNGELNRCRCYVLRIMLPHRCAMIGLLGESEKACCVLLFATVRYQCHKTICRQSLHGARVPLQAKSSICFVFRYSNCTKWQTVTRCCISIFYFDAIDIIANVKRPPTEANRETSFRCIHEAISQILITQGATNQPLASVFPTIDFNRSISPICWYGPRRVPASDTLFMFGFQFKIKCGSAATFQSRRETTIPYISEQSCNGEDSQRHRTEKIPTDLEFENFFFSYIFYFSGVADGWRWSDIEI